MNTPTKCIGLFGAIFGHKPEVIEDTVPVITTSPDKAELYKRADLKDLIEEVMSSSCGGDEVEAINALINSSEPSVEYQSTYVKTICLRCGQVLDERSCFNLKK